MRLDNDSSDILIELHVLSLGKITTELGVGDIK